MKILLALLLLTTSGCATIKSDYQQGCKDAIVGIAPRVKQFGVVLDTAETADRFCELLERKTQANRHTFERAK